MNANVLDRILDPVADCLSPEAATRLVNLRLDPVTQRQLDELAAKANEGLLTQQERDDYETIIDGLDLVAILKAKARMILSRQAL